MSADEVLLGLFPLGIVLLPGEVIPLHIFEERYQRLIADCGDAGEFGLILAEDDALRECGCTARVAQVIERLDDGRLNILVEGRSRFRIVELREPEDAGADYLRGLVAFYEDAESAAPEVLRAAVVETFRRILLLMDVDAPAAPAGEGPLSFRVAAAVDFGAALKQELLEELSEEQRLQTVLAVMETLLPRLELRKQREDAIRGNGKGH